MTEIRARLCAPTDPRGRLVSIFVGAVLLPSLALSLVLFYLIPAHAEATTVALTKRAEKVLAYVEEELEEVVRARALEAARAVPTDLLLEGRPAAIQAALQERGFETGRFESLHLVVSSPLGGGASSSTSSADFAGLREALGRFPEGDDLDSVEMPIGAGSSGTLRFRFECGWVHGALLKQYFENEFANPDQAIVVRVTEGPGNVVYENRPTPDDNFEVGRLLTTPSFRGLKLHLRYRERSIADDVRRWQFGTTALIGFIDLMLGAGLYLVYANVRREMHLSRLKSDFVANVSHELKTPLALIRLYAETLEMGRVANAQRAHEYYRVISKESQRLTQLINNILDFSRIEAGRKEYSFQPTDVAHVVEDVIESYRFQIEQQGFALEVAISEGLPEVDADQEALSQAVINLVNNAIKYSRDDKWLRVAVSREGSALHVAVSDRGIGVARDQQKRIFEKFYRAEDSLVHETKGSGLGLSLVRHIMEAHGGEVKVESASGRGSTFTLVLPLPASTSA